MNCKKSIKYFVFYLNNKSNLECQQLVLNWKRIAKNILSNFISNSDVWWFLIMKTTVFFFPLIFFNINAALKTPIIWCAHPLLCTCDFKPHMLSFKLVISLFLIKESLFGPKELFFNLQNWVFIWSERVFFFLIFKNEGTSKVHHWQITINPRIRYEPENLAG